MAISLVAPMQAKAQVASWPLNVCAKVAAPLVLHTCIDIEVPVSLATPQQRPVAHPPFTDVSTLEVIPPPMPPYIPIPPSPGGDGVDPSAHVGSYPPGHTGGPWPAHIGGWPVGSVPSEHVGLASSGQLGLD